MVGWRVAAGCTVLAALTLACATTPRFPREIAGYLADRIELRSDEDVALRVTGPGARHPVYLTGFEVDDGDGAVVVVEIWF